MSARNPAQRCVICGGSWALVGRRAHSQTCSQRCRTAKCRADKMIAHVVRFGWSYIRLPRPKRSTIAAAVKRYVDVAVTLAGGPGSHKPRGDGAAAPSIAEHAPPPELDKRRRRLSESPPPDATVRRRATHATVAVEATTAPQPTTPKQTSSRPRRRRPKQPTRRRKP
jgi:hypothetical protein